MTLHQRTAKTTIVKVKAHRGQSLNEQADMLAKAGTTDEAAAPPIELPLPTACNQEIQVQNWNDESKPPWDIQIAIREATKQYKNARLGQLKKHSPMITQRTTGDRVGRDIKAECMLSSNMPRNVVKDQIMWTAVRTPCSAWTARWKGKQDNNTAITACPLCAYKLENVAHIQTSCEVLHDAITKAHDTCWYHIWTTMCNRLIRPPT